MIQIGGLGFITVLTFLITLFKRKLQFKDRLLISQAVNSTSFADVVKFVRKIIVISLIAEFIGVLLGLPVYLTIFKDNVGDAIWHSVFTSISAFNNAGFDILGNTSLIAESGTIIETLKSTTPWAYYYLLSYIMILIVLGGISFLVILEVFSFKKRPKQYRAFTKIVLLSTTFLIVFGAVMFYVLEGFGQNNEFTLFDSLFQSITCRTAGFASYNQANLSFASQIMSCLLMFIGGSPLSTAGGVKTTTFFVIIIAMIAYLRGKPVTAFKRKYSTNMIVKAMSLVFIAFSTCIICMLIMNGFEHRNAAISTEALLFETFSAFGTVGLSANITPLLSIGSKIILCVLMFLGRLGPMTFFQLFQKNIDKNTSEHYKQVEEDFLIG
jgi:trk system potassium uptake protein TrkH